MKKYLSAFWQENRKFLFLLLSIVFFKSAIADLNSISGRSMQPTLLDGDKVWVNKLAYDVRVPFTDIFLASHTDPERGDIVIIDSEAAEKRYMRNNTLVINGQPADYEVVSSDIDSLIIREHLFDHTHEAMLSDTFTSRLSRSFGPETVPEDQFFVLGDNRDNSADSRIYSFIPRDQIIGRSSSVIFSLDSDRNYLPRADRFLAELQ